MIPSIRRALAILAVSALLPTIAAAQTTVLRYSNWLPPGHAMRVKVIEPWIAEVEKVTQGRVKIDTLPKVIGTVPSQFDVAADGQADLVVFVNGYTPGRFEISEVLELPFTSDNAEVYSAFAYRFYTQHLAQYGEYKGVHPLSLFVVGTGHIFNNKRPVRSIGDLRGMKLRTPQAGVTQSLLLLGAVPVSKPISELYELLSGGSLDGTLLVPESVASFKLVDSLPYATIVPGALYNTILTLGINDAKWQGIRADDREAISKISGEAFARKVGRAYMEGDEATWATYRKMGRTIETASPAMVQEIRTALKPVEVTWIEKAKRKGVANPEKLLETMRSELAAAK
ncbi:MAG TPA: TRAP transporter substrate-binding protein [Ramlibacter sp.]|uniref:TRAP transporter substrate-binding protein n=1 Tax=Ramlibacter sp. TaxID=1917967 RepID=UPI002C74208B|nr:TRAP transporter substrate-binding protein [Ramlibacter sp.]HVZ44186.1 TRAP transporter substrate-binding protein [Ramlibacter sp.]